MKKAVLLFCVALMMSGCGDKPTSAYKAYLDDIQHGKANEAFSRLDQKTKDQDLKNKDASSAAAKEIKDFIDSHKGLKRITFVDLKKNGDRASAKSILLFNDGTSTEVSTNYVKEKGEWKVSFLDKE